MSTYFSTFISGFAEVIDSKLRNDFPDCTVELLLDGLVVYTTSASPETIKNLRYFNNSFLLLKQMAVVPEVKPDRLVKDLILNVDIKKIVSPVIARGGTFRTLVSQENDLVGINKAVKRKMDDKIAAETRLALSPLKADWEFWFLSRREGQAFFGLRITKLSTVAPKTAKGELKRELVHLLCVLSEPQQNDIFLDPFAGSGAIPFERATQFPYKKIIANDTDQVAIASLHKKARTFHNFFVTSIDALHLSTIEDHSIDKIVTDPPWGFFNTLDKSEGDLKFFYAAMVEEMKRIIKPEGKIIILTGRKEMIENLIQNYKKYDILVNGKKAAVYLFS